MAIGATFANLAMPAIGRHSLKGIGKTGALVVKLCRLNSNHKDLTSNGPRMKVGPTQNQGQLPGRARR